MTTHAPSDGESPDTTPISPLQSPGRGRSRFKADLGAMALYGAIVHAWGLWITPLGPDAARLAGDAGITGVSAWMLSAAVQIFGSAVVPYHLVNFGLIYACMVCVYLIAIRLSRAQSWLGVFAANLWMASPGHREATVALTGMVDLLPCLAALMAFVAFLRHQARPTPLRLGVFSALLLLATGAFPINQWLGAVFLAIGWCMWAKHPGQAPRTLVCLVALAVGLSMHAWPSLEAASAFDRYGALYFCLYGIGFLPETATRFAESPILAWMAAAVVVALVWLMHRKAMRPAFIAIIAGMVLYRSSGSVQSVDPVHLVGGGSLVFATALFIIAVAILYARTMEHKRWAPILGLTSITASVVFFLLMIHAISGWREAAKLTNAYHEAAAATHEKTGEPVLVVPDFQAMRGAPLQLSRMLSYDTPFGPAVPHIAAVPLDYAPLPFMYSLTQVFGKPPQSIGIGGTPDARAVQRPWEGGELGTRITEIGYVIEFPDGFTLNRRNWVLFGDVIWAFAD